MQKPTHSLGRLSQHSQGTLALRQAAGCPAQLGRRGLSAAAPKPTRESDKSTGDSESRFSSAHCGDAEEGSRPWEEAAQGGFLEELHSVRVSTRDGSC